MSSNVLELIVALRNNSGPSINPQFAAAISAYKNRPFITFWENAIDNAPAQVQPPEPTDPPDPTAPTEPGPSAATDIRNLRTLFPALFDWNAAHNETYTATIKRWQDEIMPPSDMSGFAMHMSFAQGFVNKSAAMTQELEDSRIVIADAYSEAFKNKGDVLSKGISSLTDNAALLAADLARYGNYGSGMHLRDWHNVRGVVQELAFRDLLEYCELTDIDLENDSDSVVAQKLARVTADKLRTVKQVFKMDSTVELRSLVDLTRATHVFATSNAHNKFTTLLEFTDGLQAIGNFNGVKSWQALADYIATVEIITDSAPTLVDATVEAEINSMYGFGTGPRNSVTMEDLYGILTGKKYTPVLESVTASLAALNTTTLENAINTVLARAAEIDLEDPNTITQYNNAVTAMNNAATALSNSSINTSTNSINTLINAERACVTQAEIDLSLYTLNPNNRDLIVGFAESLPNLQPNSDAFAFLQKLADPATPAGRVYANTLNEAIVLAAQRENNVR